MNDLCVPPDLARLRDIGPWLRGELHTHLADEALETFAMRCELALQEIAVNIVNHGHDTANPDTHAPIELAASISGPTFRIDIRDHGTAYEPDGHAAPDPDVPQVHGYGLMIVRRLTRHFEYRRCDGVNHTTLEFDLPGGPADRATTT